MSILASPYIISLIVMMVSAAISIYTVRKIIFITTRRRIYDIPDNVRKIHGINIPSLGGTGIFTGFAITILFFAEGPFRSSLNFLIISALLLFFTGVYDDIMNMSPVKKLIVQLIASAITVYFSGFQLPPAIFGFFTMPPAVNVVVTTILCTFFINVFNFIDGIDGLACMLSVFYTSILGGLFIFNYYHSEAYWAFSLAGATLGLLYFNYAPAKIYMGDTGSMLSGFCIFLLSVQLLKLVGLNDYPYNVTGHTLIHAPANTTVIVFSLLFLPVFDALRVFVARISKRQSPLKGDRKHLHYYLLDAGFSHAQAAWLLLSTQAITSILSFLFQDSAFYVVYPIIALPTIIISIIAARMRLSGNLALGD